MGKKGMNLNEIEKLLENNKDVRDALIQLAKDEEMVIPEVQKILERFELLVNDKDTDFDIRHTFLALARCMQYILGVMCEDNEELEEEIDIAQDTVTKYFLEALPKENEEGYDKDNFTDLRLLLDGVMLINYVLLRRVYNIHR